VLVYEELMRFLVTGGTPVGPEWEKPAAKGLAGAQLGYTLM
jgi:hypothetical protein